MPEPFSTDRKVGVVGKGGTAVKGEYGFYPIHSKEDGLELRDGMRVSYYFKYVDKVCHVADVREMHT